MIDLTINKTGLQHNIEKAKENHVITRSGGSWLSGPGMSSCIRRSLRISGGRSSMTRRQISKICPWSGWSRWLSGC